MKRNTALFLAFSLMLAAFSATASAETYTETVRGMAGKLRISQSRATTKLIRAFLRLSFFRP